MLGQTSVSNVASGVDSEVHGVVSFSAPWDLLAATSDEQLYYIYQLFPKVTPEALYLASPRYLITRHSPPVLIFHGTDDELVPIQQSKNACKAYVSKGLNSCYLVPLEGHTHSTSLVGSAMTIGLIEKFLNCGFHSPGWRITQSVSNSVPWFRQYHSATRR